MSDFIYKLDSNVGNSSSGGQYDPMSQTPPMDEDIVNGLIATQLRTQNGRQVMATGQYQSQDFLTGISGWQIDALGNAEFNNGTFRGTFVLGGALITVNKVANIQTAINSVSTLGGGIVALVPGTYNATTSFTLPSNVTLDGNGATIDFGGTANNISATGTNTYSTGTLAVNFNSGSVTGSGTTWTAGMVGQSILIGDYWYSITARTSNTAITISPVFRAPNVSGVSYVIATTVDNIGLLNITLTNNITNPIWDYRYVNGIVQDGLITTVSPQGIRGRDSGNMQYLNSLVQNCTAGLLTNNVVFCTLNNFSIIDITGGTGLDATGMSNSSIGIMAIQNITGVGVKFISSLNTGILNYSIIECTSHGIEFASGNSDLDLDSGYINKAGGDGVKITASSNRIEITTTNISNTTGYQVNIANANCNNNIIADNTFDAGGSGAINDLGTGTIIRGNSPNSVNQEATKTGTETLTNKTLTTPIIQQINSTTNNPVKINAGSYTPIQSYTPSGGGTATLDLSLGNIHHITMPAGNITIALSNGTAGQCFIIRILQDSGGSRTVTWFTTIKWAGGSAPTLTTTASKADTVGFEITGSNTYDGFVVGQNL